MLLPESWSPPLHRKRVHLRQVLGELLPHSAEGATMEEQWQGALPGDSEAPSSSLP